MTVSKFPERKAHLPEMPPHLDGVLFAYDEQARALVLVERRAAITLPWLQRLPDAKGRPFWKHVTHEGLLGALPPVELRVQTAPGAGARLVTASGQPLRMRHGQ